MLLGLEIDGLAAQYRDVSARRGGPMMVLVAPTLPVPGLSPRLRRLRRVAAGAARASRDSVQMGVSLCTQGDINDALLYRVAVARSARTPALWTTMTDASDAAGPTEWGESHRCRPVAGPGSPDDPRYDPALLRDGDTRNVVDAYRYWTREAIVADIDERSHPLHIAIENFGNDANIGAVVRTANAFAVDTVHIVGQAPLEPARRHGDRPLSTTAPSRHHRRTAGVRR